jgi:hypothetical protein
LTIKKGRWARMNTINRKRKLPLIMKKVPRVTLVSLSLERQSRLFFHGNTFRNLN